MSYDATDENAIIIKKDDNEPAIVEEEVPSKNVEGDDIRMDLGISLRKKIELLMLRSKTM